MTGMLFMTAAVAPSSSVGRPFALPGSFPFGGKARLPARACQAWRLSAPTLAVVQAEQTGRGSPSVMKKIDRTNRRGMGASGREQDGSD